jgi:hypothetical protein
LLARCEIGDAVGDGVDAFGFHDSCAPGFVKEANYTLMPRRF